MQRKRVHRALCVFFVLALVLWLVACTQDPDMTANEIGSRMKRLYGELPACVVYDSSAREGESGYLQEERFALLLHTEKLVSYTVTEAYACMSGNPTACEEIMVFRCRTASDARDVAALCLSRAKTLDKAEGKSIPCAAICRGKTVIYYRLSNASQAKKAFDRVIG